MHGRVRIWVGVFPRGRVRLRMSVFFEGIRVWVARLAKSDGAWLSRNSLWLSADGLRVKNLGRDLWQTSLPLKVSCVDGVCRAGLGLVCCTR